jgi:hypothetical protein
MCCGNDYEAISAPIMWKLVKDDLSPLERVCREELARERPANAAANKRPAGRFRGRVGFGP